jgi:hypothetical protein
MKRITIGGKEYTFKFSVAASLYDDCIKSILDSFVIGGRLEQSAKDKDMDGTISGIISSMANIPQKAVTMFYAGLLEEHSDEIKSIKNARDLVKEYLDENKDEETGEFRITFYDILTEMMGIMADDNFFELIGLDKMIDQTAPKKRGRKKSEVGNN